VKTVENKRSLVQIANVVGKMKKVFHVEMIRNGKKQRFYAVRDAVKRRKTG